MILKFVCITKYSAQQSESHSYNKDDTQMDRDKQ